jgi:hypothetical protein
MEEEEIIVKKERRLVGRKPYEYPELRGIGEIPGDVGYGRAGAKLDPATGALMYDKYEDIALKRKIQREIAKLVESEPQAPEPEPKSEPKHTSIEFSDDSQAMIHFSEEEDVVLSANGKLKDHTTRGVVLVRNLSDKDRLWDIDVMLSDKSGIAELDFKDIYITELEPKTKVSKDYKIGDYAPSINLHEVISTHPDYPESLILEKDKTTHVTYELGLKNISAIPYRSVILRKSLPKNLENISIPDAGIEDVTTQDELLVWQVNDLGPDDVRVIKFEGDIKSDSSSDIPTGNIDLEAKGRDTITKFEITEYSAMCRNMYFIEADETDEPGSWLCRFVCENTSSFEVEILKVEVKDSSTNDVYLNIENPKIKLPPAQRWESETWIVEGKDRPSFIKNLVLNVIPGLSTEMGYKLVKESSHFQVGSLVFNKSFNKNKAIAGRVTDLTVQIEIENDGSAALEHLVMRDLVPIYLSHPSNFRIMRGSTQLNENVRFDFTPKDAGTDTNQDLSIFINDLSKYGGALSKGEKIVISYDSQIVRPAPKSKIDAPASVIGKPYLPGQVIKGEASGRMPTIDILQILRRFSIGKSIEQGENTGEYNIGILYKNRGNRPINDLVIKDVLPNNFNGSGYTLDPEKKSTVDQGTILTWNIPILKEGETTSILYKIKGEGKYHPSDAQIFYNHIPE